MIEMGRQRRVGRGLRTGRLRMVGLRKVVICTACELTGRAGNAAEARYLISVHEQLHHGRLPRQRWIPDATG